MKVRVDIRISHCNVTQSTSISTCACVHCDNVAPLADRVRPPPLPTVLERERSTTEAGIIVATGADICIDIGTGRGTPVEGTGGGIIVFIAIALCMYDEAERPRVSTTTSSIRLSLQYSKMGNKKEEADSKHARTRTMTNEKIYFVRFIGESVE